MKKGPRAKTAPFLGALQARTSDVASTWNGFTILGRDSRTFKKRRRRYSDFTMVVPRYSRRLCPSFPVVPLSCPWIYHGVNEQTNRQTYTKKPKPINREIQAFQKIKKWSTEKSRNPGFLVFFGLDPSGTSRNLSEPRPKQQNP